MAFDDAGVRWLFPERGGSPRVVAEVDREGFVYGHAADAGGPRVRATDGRLFGTGTALGPLVPMGQLPPGTTSWPALLDGGFTVRTAHGVLASSDAVIWRPLPGLPGYVLLNALIDQRGHGLGVFTMGKLAATHDHGQTWRPFADGGDEIWGLTARSGKAVIARSSDRQGFWRQVDVETGEVRLVPAKAPTFYEQALARGFAHPDEAARVQLPGLRDSAASPIAASTLRRLSFDGGFHAQERIALDGDGFLAVPMAGVGAVSPDAPISMGRLGEGARAFEGRIPPGCAPHLASLCGEHAAVACGPTLTVYRGAQTVVSLSPGRSQAIAFADEHTIVVATAVAGRRTSKVTTLTFDAQGVVPPPRVETVPFDVDRTAGG